MDNSTFDQIDLDIINGLNKSIADSELYAGARVYKFVLSRISLLANGDQFLPKDSSGNPIDLADLSRRLNSADKSVVQAALAQFDVAYGSANLEISKLQPIADVSPSAWQWFRGAVGVNAGNSPLAAFVFYYASAQYTGRFGAEFDARAHFRASSQVIEANVAQTILSGRVEALNSVFNIGLIDSTGMAANVFNGDPNLQPYSPWPGALIFQYLGVDSYFNEWILNAGKVSEFGGVDGDFKTTPGTYDLIAAISASQATPQPVYQILAAQLSDIVNNVDLARDTIVERLAASRERATEFFNQFYGDLLNGKNLNPGDLLPLYDPLILASSAAATRSAVSYRIGTIYDDLGSAALTGTDGANVIHAGSGNDEVFSLAGDDLIDGGEGRDLLNAGAGNDIVVGGSGSDSLFGGQGDDRMRGDSGNDRLQGDEGNDFLLGGRGNDRLSGDAGNDWLQGDEGSDVLLGGAGDDVLNGGTGRDTLVGGAGNDTYVFGRGSGHDIIQSDGVTGDRDAVRFESGIGLGHLSFRRAGHDLVISLRGSDDKLTIENWGRDSGNTIGRFELADSTLRGGVVNSLIQAMAAFAPPAAGHSLFHRHHGDAVSPTLASDWR